MPLSAHKQLEVLAGLAVPPAAAVPEALDLVERLVPGIGSLLLWSGVDGRVAGGYSTLIGMENGLRYYADRFGNSPEETATTGKSFRESMHGEPRAEVLSEILPIPVAEFRCTEAYREMMAPYGIHDQARVVVQHDGRPLGGLVVFRNEAGPAFRRTERARLERAAPLVGAILSRRADDAIPYVHAGEPGVAIADAEGRIEAHSARFRQLLGMLNQSAPGENAGRFDAALPVAIRRLIRRASEPDSSLVIDNAWGRFRVHWQASFDGPGRLVVLERRVPVSLRMYHRVRDLDLSFRQLQAACGLAEGHSFQALAERWGVTRHSVETHVKHLYTKLGVDTRNELMNAYVWSDGPEAVRTV